VAGASAGGCGASESNVHAGAVWQWCPGRCGYPSVGSGVRSGLWSGWPQGMRLERRLRRGEQLLLTVVAFLLGIPQGTQALALLGYRAVEGGAGSGAGVPAGVPVVSPVTQVSVIQAASRLNSLVSAVQGWVEAATKGGDTLAGGVKAVSLGEDMQSYPVGTVIIKGTKEFIRLPLAGSFTGVLLGKDGGASDAAVALFKVVRLGISSLHVGCRGVQDHLGR
jgi:hypothetical protein